MGPVPPATTLPDHERSPVLHLIVGPNGAGKSTLYEHIVGPTTGLGFINADVIAARDWGSEAAEMSYEAARVAQQLRTELIQQRRSFVTETVFSHPSKLDVITAANSGGYLVTLHVVLVPEHLAVARVPSRVARGGHSVPEDKVRARFHRLWGNVVEALPIVHESLFYDNTKADRPFRAVAHFIDGSPVGAPHWPSWTPSELSRLA